MLSCCGWVVGWVPSLTRVGHHSTSDDASRYRQDEEAKAWQEEGMSGVGRFKRFLINQVSQCTTRRDERNTDDKVL